MRRAVSTLSLWDDCSMRKTIFVTVLLLSSALIASAQRPMDPHPDVPRVSASDLVTALNGKNKPLVLQVGVARLFRYAHVRGSEYAGPASEPDGIAALRKRVQSLPRNAPIVIYCGCCPWEHCPNVKPAYDELHTMGFTNVKALYLPNNFKFDWEDKGYPTEKGS